MQIEESFEEKRYAICGDLLQASLLITNSNHEPLAHYSGGFLFTSWFGQGIILKKKSSRYSVMHNFASVFTLQLFRLHIQ